MGDFRVEEKTGKSVHRLSLTDRKKGAVTGVKDVLSFDEKEISLVTEAGTLVVKGEGLHVTRLEKQEVDLAGRVDSLTYSQGISKAKGGEGMLKRLFQ